MVAVNVAIEVLVEWKSTTSEAAPGTNAVDARFLPMTVDHDPD